MDVTMGWQMMVVTGSVEVVSCSLIWATCRIKGEIGCMDIVSKYCVVRVSPPDGSGGNSSRLNVWIASLPHE
jgi:hypothetical protein